MGIVTTKMYEERLVKIINYKKQNTWMIGLPLILAILLVGCSMALSVANIDNGIQNNIATQSPTTTGIPTATTDSREANAIQYTDSSFNGKGWQIADAGMLSGEQNQTLEKSQAISNELPSIHRKGFQSPELTFIFESVNPASDKRDPDKQYYYNDQNQILMPTLRESAEAALQQLYNITGYQVQKCYVLSTGSTLFFSMDRDNFNFGSFFSYSINPMLVSAEGVVYPWQLTISYKNDGADSPIDATKIIKPENSSSMSNDKIAKWYYENSTFGDRRKVIDTEPDHIGFIRLYLENGDFYEATLDNSRAIQYLAGPYTKGFEH